jgi:hypothetical protein
MVVLAVASEMMPRVFCAASLLRILPISSHTQLAMLLNHTLVSTRARRGPLVWCPRD